MKLFDKFLLDYVIRKLIRKYFVTFLSTPNTMKKILYTILTIVLCLILGVILAIGANKIVDKKEPVKLVSDEEIAIRKRINVIKKIADEIYTIKNQLVADKRLFLLKKIELISPGFFKKRNNDNFIPMERNAVMSLTNKETLFSDSLLGSYMIKYLESFNIDDKYMQAHYRNSQLPKSRLPIKDVVTDRWFILFLKLQDANQFKSLNMTIKEYEQYLYDVFLESITSFFSVFEPNQLYLKDIVFEELAFLSEDKEGKIFSKKELSLRMERAFLKAYNENYKSQFSVVFYLE
ncbi:hypothetical protein TUBRATIS_16040 [Tubulinosema ratisbonensis]|uniref:Uncharacterized protein n=1 Tax=Tubulinosema ratisbonensis TaxID=291195 RepID=A0A437ALI0_9MICR|nr:hypothetical protein TUBRATIS_16040 [Tubulinosema ratisbonensis]